MSNVLIVEDERRIVHFLKKGLKRNHFNVEVAFNGEHALQVMEEDEYDLVLLDLGLPIKDGWEVLRELREQGHTIPVVVMTAADISQTRVLQAGANSCILKPFKFMELLTTIQQYMTPSIV